MTPKWQKIANLAQEIYTLWFQFFGAVFASKGYPFKNIIYFSERKDANIHSDGSICIADSTEDKSLFFFTNL